MRVPVILLVAHLMTVSCQSPSNGPGRTPRQSDGTPSRDRCAPKDAPAVEERKHREASDWKSNRDASACYQARYGTAAKTKGMILLAITVDDSGRVQSVRTKTNTLPDAGVADCLVARAKSWCLPVPSNRPPMSQNVMAFVFGDAALH